MKGKERRVDFSGVGCAVRLADTVLIASTLTVAARVPNARPASRTATRYDGSIDQIASWTGTWIRGEMAAITETW